MSSSTDTVPAEDADVVDQEADEVADTGVTVTKVGEPSPDWRQRFRDTDRRKVAAVVVVLAVLAGAVAWWLLQRDDLPEDAAFRFGEDVVTIDAVDRRVDALEALYGIQVPTKDSEKSDFLRDAAKSMAVQLMLKGEAAERDIVIAEKQVDETLQGVIKERYPDGGRTAFIAALGELGATEDQVRDEIRDQLLVSRLFADVVGEVTVDDVELKKVFDERRDDLATPVRRVLGNIVVADEAAAKEVLRRVRSGESFAAVARSASLDSATRDSGGELGELSADQLEKGYAAAAFKTPVGALFGPVKTESGWNVGKVKRELPAQPANYDALREPLRQTVIAEKSLEKWRAWLGDVISKSDVTYAGAYRPDDPDAVPDPNETDLSQGE